MWQIDCFRFMEEMSHGVMEEQGVAEVALLLLLLLLGVTEVHGVTHTVAWCRRGGLLLLLHSVMEVTLAVSSVRWSQLQVLHGATVKGGEAVSKGEASMYWSLIFNSDFLVIGLFWENKKI